MSGERSLLLAAGDQVGRRDEKQDADRLRGERPDRKHREDESAVSDEFALQRGDDPGSPCQECERKRMTERALLARAPEEVAGHRVADADTVDPCANPQRLTARDVSEDGEQSLGSRYVDDDTEYIGRAPPRWLWWRSSRVR